MGPSPVRATPMANSQADAAAQPQPKPPDEGGAAATGNSAPPRPARSRRPLILLIAVAAAVGLGFAAYSYWLANRGYETTDDANIDGRAISIAPQVSGNVVSLDVNDNQFVHKGDPLVHIDNRQYIIDRESAEATLATAKAQLAGFKYAAEVAHKNFPAALLLAQAQLASAQAVLAKAQSDYNRQVALPRQATTQQEVDAAAAALGQAQAQVQQAQAQVQQAEPVSQRIGQADCTSERIQWASRPSASQARPGFAQSVLYGGDGAAGRMDHQTQCRSRHLRAAGSADFLDRLAASLGHRQFQGEPTQFDAAGSARDDFS